MEEGKRTNFEEKIPHYSPKKTGENLKKTLVAFVIIIAAAVLGVGSTYQIREQEQVVLTTLGKAEAVTEPGLHFKIPFIQQVQKVNTTIQGFAIGYNESTNEIIITGNHNCF